MGAIADWPPVLGGRARLLFAESSRKDSVGIATFTCFFQMFGAEKLCLRQESYVSEKLCFKTENNYIECVVLLVSSDYDCGISATSLNV